MTEMTRGIVVGYDGSPDSAHALRWAAREAKARGTTLTVCLAWTPDHMALPTESDLCDLAREHGQIILARGLPYAESVLGPGRVRAELAGGSAAYVLCERSRPPRRWWSAAAGTASCVTCCSDRFPGRWPGTPAGGSSSCAASGGRPTRPPARWWWARTDPRRSQAAVAFAFEEAALRDVPLVAVCALTDASGRLGEGHQVQEDFEHLLACEAKEHPEVTVVRRVLAGTPRAALLTASADAQMIVVGARGRGGLEGMSLGSVAQAVLHHAPCPVGVVHATACGR